MGANVVKGDSLAHDGSLAFITGSTCEGQAYARQLAKQNIQDIDIMIVEGIVDNKNSLIPTGLSGFVQIESIGVTPNGTNQFQSKINRNGILCIDGKAMKEKYRQMEKTENVGLYESRFDCHTNDDSSNASVQVTHQIQWIDNAKQFENVIKIASQQRNLSNFSQLKINYCKFCMNIRSFLGRAISIHSQFSLLPIEKDVQDVCILAGRCYDYQLPQVLLVRSLALLDFYDKHKHIANSDFVPALQLKFWPDNVQPFFERIKQNRPHLHDLILSKTSMHVVTKWSKKTCIDEQDLEFRYSFSAVEILLAKHRTPNEQVLNGIARSIYYKYLKEIPPVLPSYFIKTSVLWMCETMNLNDLQETSLSLAQKWIKYVVDILNSGKCAHYFIDDFNIFELYTPETLEKTKHILLNEVKLDEIIETHMYTAQNQQTSFDTFKLNKRNYVFGLKVKDVLPLINDYRTLKEDWIGLFTEIKHPNKELSEALDILSSLRRFDGEKMENWKTFRELFLDHNDSSEYAEPIWNDDVVQNEDPIGFCSMLSMIGTVLHLIQQNIDDSPNFLTQNVQTDDVDVNNYQNVFQPIPWSDLMRATRSIPLDQSMSSFRNRTVLDEHPNGPGEPVEQDNYMPHFSIKDVCQIAPDKNMTFNEVANYYKDYANEELFKLARAVELSMKDY
ncbi:unnamed protein product [Didymodactylos carnosus]|uniref:Mab-21-like HhH/H2TH-like domain-containing protein n=1 Tax=Didymodactylos carnosus TaxID=1234261 RepID=A0A814JVJ6_9BILA|nr:unnamed protein product [Didymodactylos carnosus]CAF1040918.1 unnamed protein product [Didymodactylos carnosus]CAF3606677.1 unnamed protein product [Didymodactylos carnosus]CAF3811134.1 unnamed protein product [Didymodactylos carnosus]